MRRASLVRGRLWNFGWQSLQDRRLLPVFLLRSSVPSSLGPSRGRSRHDMRIQFNTNKLFRAGFRSTWPVVTKVRLGVIPLGGM
jgi:hypothetical protein